LAKEAGTEEPWEEAELEPAVPEEVRPETPVREEVLPQLPEEALLEPSEESEGEQPAAEAQPQVEATSVASTPLGAAHSAGSIEDMRASRAKMYANHDGYVCWTADGLQLVIRSVSTPESKAPAAEQLREALEGYQAPAGLAISITETLGRADASLVVSGQPGSQARLLVSAGQIMELLVAGDLYEEIHILPADVAETPTRG
jgi:hypothetical protein